MDMVVISINKKISIIDVEAINIELYIPLGYLVAVILEFEETDIMKLDKILISDYIQVKHYLYKSEAKINSRIYKSLFRPSQILENELRYEINELN